MRVSNDASSVFFFSRMCHSYLAEDAAVSWFFFSSLSSLLSVAFSSANFEVRFLNLSSLDLDFFSLISSGVIPSGVPPYVFLSELVVPASWPVWCRCVTEMWDARCEMWVVRCEMWDVRCEMWDVRCEMWDVDLWDVTCKRFALCLWLII